MSTFRLHGDVCYWVSRMAGCFIAGVPIAILYSFFVDRFIAGFTAGALKQSDPDGACGHRPGA